MRPGDDCDHPPWKQLRSDETDGSNGMIAQATLRTRLRYILSYIPTPFWTRRYPHLTRVEKWKLNVLCDILFRHSGGMVFSGPFASMKLCEGSALSHDPRMIVGSYEQEVHDVINQVIADAPSHIVDIGAAYGYYAVGLAVKIANATVTAFEAIEEEHWRELKALAELNKVSHKIDQRGLCTPAEFAKVCTEAAFVLSDCEGAELELCDPATIPALKSCTLLIELHEFHKPRLVATLVQRFRSSHSIKIIDEERRDPSRYRILKRVPAGWRSTAVEEAKWIGDGAQRTTTSLRFMLLTPKISTGGVRQ
jgi:predicted O-methyltransferase YrrM